jgi:protein SCO1/2
MTTARPRLFKVVIALIAVSALAAGFWLASSLRQHGNEQPAQIQQPRPRIQGLVLKIPRQIAVPQLTKDDSRPFTSSDLKGRWTLVFFGYTHCPDICPMTMNVLAEAKKKAASDFPQVVFVSVDPQRDSVDMLGDYVHYFDPEFIGVTGDEQMIQALALQMSVMYSRMPGTSGEDDDYLVDHSSSVLLVNPEAKLAAFLKAPHTPSSINESVNKVRDLFHHRGAETQS